MGNRRGEDISRRAIFTAGGGALVAPIVAGRSDPRITPSDGATSASAPNQRTGDGESRCVPGSSGAESVPKDTDGSDFHHPEAIVQRLIFRPDGPEPIERTLREKLRDTTSAKDFGAVGDGITDNATAFLKLIAAAEAGTAIFFPRGIYASSVPLRFVLPARLYAAPGTRVKLLAPAPAVLEFDYLLDGQFFDHGGYVDNLVLDGNGLAEDGLSLRGVVSGSFSNVRATNVRRAGLHLHWAQLCLFNNYACSDNVEKFDKKPSFGILADTQSCSANTFVNPVIERVSSHGIYAISLINSVFINGTSEGNGGAGIMLGSPAKGSQAISNTVIGMDLEENSGGDIVCNANCTACDFYSLKAGFNTPGPSVRIMNGSRRNTFYGGVTGHISVEVGAVDTTFDNVSLLGAGATISDRGDFSRWRNIRNLSDSSKLPDSVSAGAAEANVQGGDFYQADAKLDLHHVINAMDATLTIANPLNPTAGQELCYTILNFGGALRVNWGSTFRTTGWSDPAPNTSRSITFRYLSNFAQWHPVSIGPADVQLAADEGV